MDWNRISDRLDKQTMRSDILLGGLKLLHDASRESPTYTDPRNFPFWYYLGQELLSWRTEINVVQIGGHLGLLAASFLKGHTRVSKWLVLDNKDQPDAFICSNIRYVSPNTVRVTESGHNDFLSKKIYSDQWDLGIIAGTYDKSDVKFYLESVWQQSKTGLLVVDYITSSEHIGKVFDEFCRVKNREPVRFATRYGIGIIQR